MKRLIVTLLFAGLPVMAATLKTQKQDLDRYQENIQDNVKELSALCGRMEALIPSFNFQNNLANASLAQKRAEKEQSRKDLSLALEALKSIRSDYTKALGVIDAKSASLRAIKGNVDLRKELADAKKQLDQVQIQITKLKRSEPKYTQYKTREDYNKDLDAFLTKYFSLKDQESQLIGKIEQKESDLKKGPPSTTQLEIEIRELKINAADVYRTVIAKSETYAKLKAADNRIANELEKAEKDSKAISNFVLPEICDSL